MTKFTPTVLNDDIRINKCYTFHYFEFSKDYKFFGEEHNFWELVYVDKGTVTATAEDKKYSLKSGEMIFHKPCEWHNLEADGKVAPNVAIITFECKSEQMAFFEGKILTVSIEQKRLLSKIFSEYSNNFSTPLNDPFTTKLTRKTTKFCGSEQLIRQYLCELLILFLRDSEKNSLGIMGQHTTNPQLNIAVNFMLDNISGDILANDVAKHCKTNKTSLNKLFKEHFGEGIISYFIFLKTEKAKEYLRSENYNVSQISDMLGYSSVHYFSRQFKKQTGMSPTEYTSSIGALTNLVKSRTSYEEDI